MLVQGSPQAQITGISLQDERKREVGIPQQWSTSQLSLKTLKSLLALGYPRAFKQLITLGPITLFNAQIHNVVQGSCHLGETRNKSAVITAKPKKG